MISRVVLSNVWYMDVSCLIISPINKGFRKGSNLYLKSVVDFLGFNPRSRVFFLWKNLGFFYIFEKHEKNPRFLGFFRENLWKSRFFLKIENWIACIFIYTRASQTFWSHGTLFTLKKFAVHLQEKVIRGSVFFSFFYKSIRASMFLLKINQVCVFWVSLNEKDVFVLMNIFS